MNAERLKDAIRHLQSAQLVLVEADDHCRDEVIDAIEEAAGKAVELLAKAEDRDGLIDCFTWRLPDILAATAQTGREGD